MRILKLWPFAALLAIGIAGPALILTDALPAHAINIRIRLNVTY
ncbi:hypothetical protein [Novosphingobium sp. 9]|nr:hypothetical protein [Novosphingobium sp. 9]